MPHRIEHYALVDAHPRSPAPCLGDLVVRVDVDQVGKGVGLAGGDGWDVVLVRVGERDDLEQRVLERRLACPANFGALYCRWFQYRASAGGRERWTHPLRSSVPPPSPLASTPPSTPRPRRAWRTSSSCAAASRGIAPSPGRGRCCRQTPGAGAAGCAPPRAGARACRRAGR